ncbi:arginine decarboxylase, pyruvoyl-dependent [Candidatus Woesearchaeota archaeon]|nr:arginine decarboxylase, pyruvoyl-dependent [Candidatus Woesearchaeota archaeon]
MDYIPKKVFLTKGKGVHKEQLASFEAALRDAGIEKLNLVYVSSIVPPNCKIIKKEKGLEEIAAGQIDFVVMSRNQTNEPHRLISASVGLAIPKDKSVHGYISEHHACGQNEKEAGDYSEDLAASMLATTLGIEFDSEEDYDKRKQIYRMSKKIVRSQSITQTTAGHKKGYWTTVLAAAVFLPQEDSFIQFLKEIHAEEYNAWLKSRT